MDENENANYVKLHAVDQEFSTKLFEDREKMTSQQYDFPLTSIITQHYLLLMKNVG